MKGVKSLKYSGLILNDISAAPGLCVSFFTQGCPHRCPGCHNPETWDFGCGTTVPVEAIVDIVRSNPLCRGVTFSGGEPFDQPEDSLTLALAAKESGLNVWSYSGYLFEQLLADEKKSQLLKELDVLVDGPFVLSQRSLALAWRGSRNQRVIDVPKSLAAGEVVLVPDPVY